MSADKKSSKCKKFNVGDAVQLRKSSEEYSKDNDPQGEDPIKTKGTVVANDGTIVYPLKIEWSNGQWNWYNHEDLKLWKEGSKDTTDKPEEVETPCVKTPVPGTKYEVVLDLWSWNFKKGDILVFKRIDRDGTWEFEGVNTVCGRPQWLWPERVSSVVQLVVDAEGTVTNSELPVIGEKYEIINTDIFASWVKVGDVFTLVGEIGNSSYDLDKEDKPAGKASQVVPKSTFFEHVKKVDVEVKDTETNSSTEETYVPVKGDKFKVTNKGPFAAFNVGDIIEFVEEFVSYGYVTWLFTNGEETQECGKSYVWEQVERVVEEEKTTPPIEFVVGKEYRVIKERSSSFYHGFDKDEIVKYEGMSRFGGMPSFCNGKGKLQVLPLEYVEEVSNPVVVTDPTAWIDWNSGAIPVPVGTLVDVKHRDGDVFYGEKAGVAYSCAEHWVHQVVGGPGNIVAYRLHVPKAVAPVEMATAVVKDEGISLVVGEEYEVINEDHWNFKIGDKVVYLGKDGFGWEFCGIVEGVYVTQYIVASHKTPYRVKKIVKSDTNHEKLLADLKTQIETQCLDLMKGTPFNTLEVTSFELPEITDGILSAIEAAVREDATDVSDVDVGTPVSITPTYNLNVGNLDLSALTREQLCLIFEAIEEVL